MVRFPGVARRLRALPHGKDVASWAILVVLGSALNQVWLEPAIEPAALPLVAGFRGEEPLRPSAAVVDVSFLYDVYPTVGLGGSIDSSRLDAFLTAVSRLEEDVRPRAIGFDILVAQVDAKLQAKTGVAQPEILPQHEAFLGRLAAFERAQPADRPIRVRVGTDALTKPDVAGLPAETGRMWATLQSFRELDQVPLRFGFRAGLDLLPVAVLNDERELAGRGGTIPPLRYTGVPCPDDLPPGERPHECIFVNYNALRHAEALTIEVPQRRESREDWSAEEMFGPEAKAKLRRLGGPKIWFVGVAKDPNETDTLAVDREAFVAGRSALFRGIYQHVAVLDSALNSPIRQAGVLESFAYDFFFSFSGLMMVIARKRAFRPPEGGAGRSWSRWPLWALGVWPVLLAWPVCRVLAGAGALIRGRFPGGSSETARHVEIVHRGARIVLMLAPLAAAWLLARALGVYWIGVLATWIYVFMEPFLGSNLLGHEDASESGAHG